MNKERFPLLRACLQVSLKVFSVLALAISLIMILQYVNLLQFNPESSEQLPALKQELLADKGNAELQNYVRELDLLARRSWFIAQEQLQLGGTILAGLVGFLLLGVLFLNLTAAKEAKMEQPKADERAAKYTRYLLSCLGLGVCAAAYGVSHMGMPAAPASDDKAVAAAGAADAGTPAPAQEELAPVAYASIEDIAKNWTQFRGPQQSASSASETLFTDWDEATGENMLWKSKIPLHGFSSPIMWGDKIFVSGGDEKERKLYCYSATTGELLWEHLASDIPGSPAKAPKVTKDTGYAASTPATDGHRVFAAFATGDLMALDHEGKRVWVKNLGALENPYGYASSLVATNHHLLVQYDNDDAQTLYLFDSATGDELWKKTREASISWSTPVIVDVDAENKAVVLVTSTTVEAYDFKTGKEMWKQDIMGGEVAVCPVIVGDKVFVCNDNATAALLDVKSGEIVWESSDFDMPDVSSPILSDGVIILCTSGGIIEGVDVETGELLWEYEAEYGFYNSVAKVGNQFIVFDMEGTCHIFEADQEGYKEVAIKKLSESVLAMPIAKDGKLWLRGKDHLYCFGKAQ